MLHGGHFNRLKQSLRDVVQYQEKVLGGDAHLTLWSVSVETIQERSENLIFGDINDQISQFVCNG